MIGWNGRLAGLRLGDRNAAPFAKGEQFLFGARIKYAAAANDEGLLGRAQQGGGLAQFVGVGPLPALAMHAFFEKAFGIVIGLGLNVLAEGERDGSAFRRIGQHRDGPGQGWDDLFGPADAVEIARDRLEAIVGADRAVAE